MTVKGPERIPRALASESSPGRVTLKNKQAACERRGARTIDFDSDLSVESKVILLGVQEVRACYAGTKTWEGTDWESIELGPYER